MKGAIKKVCVIFFCILVCIFSASFFSSGEINVAAADSERIKVGFFEFNGYHMLDANGKRSGYGYDFLQMVARYTDMEFEYLGYDKSWSQMQQMLTDGEIDLLTSAQKTPEREELYDFSENPIGSSATIFSVRSGNDKLIQGNYSTYNGIKVGMLSGNSRNESFKNFASEKGFEYTPADSYGDIEDLWHALQNNEVDAIVTSNLRTVENEWILEEFDPSPFYAVVKRGNRTLLQKVNYAIEQMSLDTPNWKNDLMDKYYSSDTGDSIYLNVSEKNYLESLKSDGKVLKVTMNPDNEPYSYFENGEAKGIIPDIFAEVARRLDFDYEIVQPTSRDGYVALYESKSVDVVLDFSNDFALAEEKGYEITLNYLKMSISMVARSGFTGNIKSAALPTSAKTVGELKNVLKDFNVSYYDSAKACLDAVIGKKVDVAYLNTYFAQKYANENVRNKLIYTIMPDFSVYFSLGVNRNADYNLLTILNKGISGIGDDLIDRIIVKNTAYKLGELSFIDYIYTHPIVGIVSVAVIALVVILIILFAVKIRNSKLEKQKNSELSRFIGYICEVYDKVLEIDLSDHSYVKYVMDGNGVKEEKGKLTEDDIANVVDSAYEDDTDKLRNYFTAEYMENLIDRKGQDYFECRLEDGGGNYVWYSYLIKAIPADKAHPKNVILLKRNINATKLEQEKTQSILKDALAQAQAASEAKGNFTSRISHEIRTPLNAIIGYMSIAKGAQGDSEKYLHCLENAEVAAKHLLNIVNSVLDLSSIESGKMKIASEDFDLKALILNISTMFYNQARQKDVDFSVRVEKLTEEIVIGDQLRVNQILMNLLSNAVKFTAPNGKVVLNVTQVDLTDESVYVRFLVKDNGIGMSEEYLDRIFTPFEQESVTTARNYGGTGLGMSITKNLVNMMNGSISVESRQNQGTEFTVMLCFRRSEKNVERNISNTDFSKIRTLIVDDEKGDCEYIKEILKRCGIKSDFVCDGEKAIKKIIERQNSEKAYNMCIMDLKMPGLNGVETAKRIKKECSVNIPIIIATAYDISEYEDAAKDAGVDKIISKPLFQSTLFDFLVSLYGKYETAATKTVSAPSLNDCKVLLAEDNEMNMEIATEILGNAGIKITKAWNGKEALDLFCASSENDFQAILMDIQMPVMDGYEAAKAIRASKHPNASDIPIIAMTANAFNEDVSDALNAGMNAHIAKPIDVEKLFTALGKLIGKV